MALVMTKNREEKKKKKPEKERSAWPIPRGCRWLWRAGAGYEAPGFAPRAELALAQGGRVPGGGAGIHAVYVRLRAGGANSSGANGTRARAAAPAQCKEKEHPTVA